MLAPTRLAPALLLLMLLMATAASAADCSLIITPLTDRASYQRGEPIQVQLQVSSSSAEPCVLTVPHQEVVLEVLDNDGNLVAHTRQAVTPSLNTGRSLELEPGESTNLVSVPWAQGAGRFPCLASKAVEQVRAVGPGTYRLRVSWVGVGASTPAVESYPFEISKRRFQAHVPVMSSFGISLLASLLALAMWAVMKPAPCEGIS